MVSFWGGGRGGGQKTPGDRIEGGEDEENGRNVRMIYIK